MTEIATETTTAEDRQDTASDDTHTDDEGVAVTTTPESESDPDTFPREVVEELRKENGKHRTRGQALARRLHTELVRATGRLADPTDLAYDDGHLDDPDALAAAIDDLLDRKPHLATRKPVGDIGQGQRGTTAEPFSLLGLLKQRT